MSEWIATRISKPPEGHTILLYVVQFHEDGKSMFHDNISTGFYGNDDYDKVGFYFETMDRHEFIEENETFKVIAWTLLPRKPYKGIFSGDWGG